MRVTRLSTSALDLLTAMTGENAAIKFDSRAGTYNLHVNGGAPMHLNPRTLAVLCASGMLTMRHDNGNGRTYTLTGRARLLLSCKRAEGQADEP